MSNQHKIWNFDLGNLIREEELNGRHYVVVPMTMILEGVHVGSQGSVYYSLEELAKTPKMWNMKPIVIEHPFRGDTATELEVYKKQAVGMIMNTHFVDGKLKAEAWIDTELANQKCPELLDHIRHKLPMEISTGLFSELVMEQGVWQGEPYTGRIINIKADHLAILPQKQGACSLADGAGLLINQKFEQKDKLNIISVVLNQEYPAGSIVVDYDAADDEEESKTDSKTAPKSEPRKKEKSDKTGIEDQPIEIAPQTQVFTTADGYKITVEPPAFSTFKPQPPTETPPETPSEEKVELVPMHDNPTVVADDTIESGSSEYVTLLHNICAAADAHQVSQKRWQSTCNDVLPQDKGKHGGRRFTKTSEGFVQYGRPKKTYESEQAQSLTEKRKRLRSNLVELQSRLIPLRELLSSKFPGYELRTISQVLEFGVDKELTASETMILTQLMTQIQKLELLVSKNTDEYWKDFDATGPRNRETVDTYKFATDRTIDDKFTGSQLNLEEGLSRLDSEYAAFKRGKPSQPDAWFVFSPETTDADVQEMKEQLRAEAEESDEDNTIGEVFRNVQAYLQKMRTIPKSNVAEQNRYKVGLVMAMDRYPFLKTIPELAKLTNQWRREIESSMGSMVSGLEEN